MPAPLEYPTTPDDFGNPLAPPRIFRRRTTVVFSLILAILPLVVGGVIATNEISHGALDVAATVVTAITLSLFALVMGAWPHVVMDHERMAVHNSFFWFDIPYAGVSELSPTHLGVVVRTYAGKVVAVAAYASGSGRRIFAHQDAAAELKRAVEERTAFADDTAWKSAPRPRRHANVLNLAVLGVAVAASVALIVLASH